MSNIILIGFMGCGKSTVGIRLSYRLRRIVEDTDKLIEKKTEKKISDIFKEDGEAFFREQETECVKELLFRKEEMIVATGGGLPVRAENRVLLKQLGCVVYLKLSPEQILERVKGDTERPLLACENPLLRIKELLGEREAFYEEAADLVISADGKNMEEVLAELLRKLTENGCIAGGEYHEDSGD